jgi:GNAT superfamily N-acetyltransferase
MKVMIRPARPADAATLLPLVQQFVTSFVIEPAVWTGSFHQILQTPHAHLLVAEGDQHLLGYLLGFEHLTFYANGQVAWVEEIMVGAAYRRQGIGGALMGAFETWAAQREAKLVALATRRAAPFYRALGYEESAVYFRRLL